MEPKTFLNRYKFKMRISRENKSLKWFWEDFISGYDAMSYDSFKNQISGRTKIKDFTINSINLWMDGEP